MDLDISAAPSYDVKLFHACLKTTREMLTDRGFDTKHIGLLTSCESEFHVEGMDWDEEEKQVAQAVLEKTPLCASNGNQVIMLLCVWDPDPANHYISGLLDRYIQEEAIVTFDTSFSVSLPMKHAILMTFNPLPMTDVKDLALVQKKTRVECFVQQELLFNRTHHAYVPRHELISREEAIQVLRTLNTLPMQCHRIMSSDIIARYYGAQVGDVFCIHRRDLRSGEKEITYRVVV
jgi:DNA-directed RNA polymerase subunit H (RpoH/RPB5)